MSYGGTLKNNKTRNAGSTLKTTLPTEKIRVTPENPSYEYFMSRSDRHYDGRDRDLKTHGFSLNKKQRKKMSEVVADQVKE